MPEDQPVAEGLVIAAHGQRGILEATNGDALPYLVKGKRLRVVCGDHVRWTREANGKKAIVSEILSRNNALRKPSPNRNQPDVIAANLTCMIVVFAPLPKPDWFVIDRYLCSGRLMDCRLFLLGNKHDMTARYADPNISGEIENYVTIGYEYLSVSTRRPASIGFLLNELKGETGILVGQSGVGKSSIVNQLVPDAHIAVSAISKASHEGTHTTTASVMHRLPGGGRLIDSPGVRDYVPAIDDPQSVQSGYPEILAVAQNCRFSNCQHQREPECAVKSACNDGLISVRRYESYRRLQRAIAANPR
jgi:ribosome biogenesis GTPase